MKKYVFIIIALIAMSQHVCAQGMTATLQSGDSLTVFYGADAFSAAYFYANDGDQITLSAGNFYTPGTIEKSIKITGVGGFLGNTTKFESLIISAADVRIEGVQFSKTLDVSGSENLIVSRCRVNALNASADFKNAVFDASVFFKISGMPYASEFTFKNCTIQSFLDTNSPLNLGLILNCVIYYYGDSNDGKISYYTYYSSARQPYAIYKNNILGTYQYATEGLPAKSPSEFYYNVGYQENSNTSFKYGEGCVNMGNRIMKDEDLFGTIKLYPAQPQNAPNGDDGTPVGPFGGSGFSYDPSIPLVYSSDIDSSTNDEGKINVKIVVGVEPGN